MRHFHEAHGITNRGLTIAGPCTQVLDRKTVRVATFGGRSLIQPYFPLSSSTEAMYTIFKSMRGVTAPMQDFAEDIQIGLEGVEMLDDNDTGFQVRKGRRTYRASAW